MSCKETDKIEFYKYNCCINNNKNNDIVCSRLIVNTCEHFSCEILKSENNLLYFVDIDYISSKPVNIIFVNNGKCMYVTHGNSTIII